MQEKLKCGNLYWLTPQLQQTIEILTCAISVVDIMIDACRGASCTWPSPTQPTLCTLCCSSNPVHSVTPRSGGACCLTLWDCRCSVSSTAGIVCVRFWFRPLLACYIETVTLCTSNTMVNFIFSQCIKIKHTSNTKRLRHVCTVISMKLSHASDKHVQET